MKLHPRILPLIGLGGFLISCDSPDYLPAPPLASRDKISTPKNKKTVTPTTKAKTGPVSNIDAKERMEAAALLEARDPVAQAIKLFMAEMRGAFDEKEFEKLESTAHELRQSKELFADGSWKLYHFYQAVNDRYHGEDKGFIKDLEIHKAWESAYPKSITQRVAIIDLLTGYAWHARGNGYANTVTEEGWRLMGSRLKEAKRIFDLSRELTEKDPCLWDNAMTVAMGMSANTQGFDSILESCRTEHPDFWHIEANRAYTLLPRWFGEKGDWEKFAAEAAEVEGGLGAETYARVVIRNQGYYANVYRDAGKPSWSKTKEGLEILREKYPTSIKIDNYCAKLGVSGRDREFAKAAFERLGDEYVKTAWGSKPEKFVHFRTWARTGKW